MDDCKCNRMERLAFTAVLIYTVLYGFWPAEALATPLSVIPSTQRVSTLSEPTARAPTTKDLADCREVMDSTGHGPDPGSSEWWTACRYLRTKKQAPSIDCSKAKGQVEELICSDSELMILDVELARAYASVSAKSTGPVLKSLRANQRGWIKGRNECWKATQVSIRECVVTSYRSKLAALRSQL